MFLISHSNGNYTRAEIFCALFTVESLAFRTELAHSRCSVNIYRMNERMAYRIFLTWPCLGIQSMSLAHTLLAPPHPHSLVLYVPNTGLLVVPETHPGHSGHSLVRIFPCMSFKYLVSDPSMPEPGKISLILNIRSKIMPFWGNLLWSSHTSLGITTYSPEL